MKTIALLLVATLSLRATVIAEPVHASVPDVQHEVLSSLAGHWSVTQSLWIGDAKAPKIDKGTAEFVMVLNGRHLRQNLQIDDGTNFEGLGFLGYDNASGQMFSTWMDVNFPGMVLAYGPFNGVDKTFTLKGRLSGAAPSSPTVPVREVITVLDANHFRYEFYETHEGKEALGVRLDYARK